MEDEEDARFIICDPKLKAFQQLTDKYLSDKWIFVETPAWVTRTIKSGRVKATPKPEVNLLTPARYANSVIISIEYD